MIGGEKKTDTADCAHDFVRIEPVAGVDAMEL
jgi:hypothetical protein